MTTIKLTSKRQATFPRELCDSLGLEPGDELVLIPKIENGKRVWLLQVADRADRPWFGKLRKYAGTASDHSVDAMRESIRKGRTADRKP